MIRSLGFLGLRSLRSLWSFRSSGRLSGEDASVFWLLTSLGR